MKTQINPLLGIGLIIVVVAIAALLIYRGTSKQQVDTTASMTPELKARIQSVYGGAPQPSGAPRGPSATSQGTR
jgi:hypothetical protein